MKHPDKESYAVEAVALKGRKAPLPPHAGEIRYQTALDNDHLYRLCLVGALVLAFAAGTGFGRLFVECSWRVSSFLTFAGAGFGWRCMSRRTRAVSERTPIRLRTVAIASWLPILAVSFAGSCYLLTGAPEGLNVGFPHFVVLGLVLAGFSIFDRWIRLRRSFAPAAALTVLLHLSGAIHPEVPVYSPLVAQLAAAVIEFVLLAVVGYRQAIAEIVRLPRATYRESPQCIVPRKVLAWEHPLQIDSVRFQRRSL